MLMSMGARTLWLVALLCLLRAARGGWGRQRLLWSRAIALFEVGPGVGKDRHAQAPGHAPRVCLTCGQVR